MQFNMYEHACSEEGSLKGCAHSVERFEDQELDFKCVHRSPAASRPLRAQQPAPAVHQAHDSGGGTLLQPSTGACAWANSCKPHVVSMACVMYLSNACTPLNIFVLGSHW
jgi:hypothetical protein